MFHKRYFISCFLFLVFTSFSAKPLIAHQKAPVLEVNVGIILDLDSRLGKMMKTSILMAFDDFNDNQKHTTKIVQHVKDARNDTMLAASAAIDLVKNFKVHAILGPQRSNQAHFVIEMGNKVKVPIISTATSPAISSRESEYFIRAAVSSSFQTKAIAALFQAYNWREVVIIYEDTDAGNGFVPYFIDAMRNISTFVTCRKVISPSFSGDQILQELEKLKNISTRVFVVHMGQLLGTHFFSKVKEAGMMSKGYAWITTDFLTSLFSSMDTSVIESMQGVVGLKPHIQMTSVQSNFTRKWRKKFQQENPGMNITEPNALVLWAYDSSKALAMEIENVVKSPPKFKSAPNSVVWTELDAIETSDTGPLVIKSLRNFTIMGLSGNFRIVEGELEPPPYEIVNIHGTKENVIGYWSEKTGISGQLKQNDGAAYNTSKDNLGFVIWPGETPNVTKGWEIPVRSDQKLKIGIPVQKGFSQFVYVEENHPSGPVNNPTGFSIDIFKEVMNSMPYYVPYEFYPIYLPEYDDIVKQVKDKKYDAVVGDVTILAERSNSVDFTLPYVESGLVFVVPVGPDKRKNPWIFLKPFTKDLWLTMVAVFVLSGIVVWVLEHRVNKEFRGPPHNQVGMIFYFSFSTLVFAHKEKIMSNLTRFVVLVWIFVVLVLTSSYQASLTSILTVQTLRPTVTTISDLKKNRECIGYKSGSYVHKFLINDFNCTKNYTTLEEYHEYLSKGSKDGGVKAIADELPYINLFLQKYPGKYTIIDTISHTAGFGFVFPKGCPLVADVSRAVLQVTQGKLIKNITETYFGAQTVEVKNNEDAVPLSLESFKGLFLVSAVTFALALMIFFIVFIYEVRDIIGSSHPFLHKLSKIVKVFYQEKENPSVGRKPGSDATAGGNEQHIDTQGYENWQTPVGSFSRSMEDVEVDNI